MEREKPEQYHPLLRPEQVIYNSEWQKIIGNRERAIYNAIGPDLSTIILLADPTEIIGIDPAAHTEHTADYVKLYWDFIDVKPIMRAGAFGYNWGITPCGFQPTVHDWKLFIKHQTDRRNRGYWDLGAVNKWDLDRLLILEFKKLGVNRESIDIKKISGSSKYVDHLRIDFDLAYPGKKIRRRRLSLYGSTLDYLTQKNAFLKHINGADFYYQKSLPDSNLTLKYLDQVTDSLGKHSAAALGWVTAKDWNWPGGNDSYSLALQKTLGRTYRKLSLPDIYNNMIDNLPDDDFEMNKYGMKLHVFAR